MKKILKNNDRWSGQGFTLLELIIAMSLGLIVLGAMYGALTIQDRNVSLQEQVAEMQQNARAGMEIMLREIMMAGYNPQKTISIGTQPGITTASANALGFVADLNANGNTTADTTNPNENIMYNVYYAAGVSCLGRTSNGSTQVIVQNIESWTFAFYDRDGNLLSSSPAVTEIKKIQVSLTARTAKPDPQYTDPGHGDHYRRYTLTFNVAPRNIDL